MQAVSGCRPLRREATDSPLHETKRLFSCSNLVQKYREVCAEGGLARTAGKKEDGQKWVELHRKRYILRGKKSGRFKCVWANSAVEHFSICRERFTTAHTPPTLTKINVSPSKTTWTEPRLHCRGSLLLRSVIYVKRGLFLIRCWKFYCWHR